MNFKYGSLAINVGKKPEFNSTQKYVSEHDKKIRQKFLNKYTNFIEITPDIIEECLETI